MLSSFVTLSHIELYQRKVEGDPVAARRETDLNRCKYWTRYNSKYVDDEAHRSTRVAVVDPTDVVVKREGNAFGGLL
jgi:hypothetical protein